MLYLVGMVAVAPLLKFAREVKMDHRVEQRLRDARPVIEEVQRVSLQQHREADPPKEVKDALDADWAACDLRQGRAVREGKSRNAPTVTAAAGGGEGGAEVDEDESPAAEAPEPGPVRVDA